MNKMGGRLLGIGIGTIGILGSFFCLLAREQLGTSAGNVLSSAVSQTRTVEAARGSICDRTGQVLVEDETVYTIAVTARAAAESISKLETLFDQAGVAYTAGTVGTPFVFAEDVPQNLLVAVEAEQLDGVEISCTGERVYATTSAAHLLGRVGPIYAEKWAEYQAAGYALSDRVGIDGLEAAFEAQLHGSAGVLATVTQAGESRQVWQEMPVPGNRVELTLDLDLQTAVEAALAEYVPRLSQTGGGACVVLDVSDGGILACASYPTYDLSTFQTDYTALVEDAQLPMFNRALMGAYPPGSTFKIVTAAAGLEEGIITPETEILDTGVYTFYADYQPKCWLYRQSGKTHGTETVSDAIRDSCNVFFYEVGRQVGIERLEEYARAFGLGESTGVELGERTGILAGPDYAQSVGQTWYPGNTLAAAIGQSDNLFTPLQLAVCTATLVNGGTRYAAHLLQQVTDWAGNPVEVYQPEVIAQLALSPAHQAAIQTGMGQAAQALGVFQDLPVAVGAKTGSAQVAGQENANAVMVCFAPYDQPQIAMALVVEEGGSGAALGELASAILQAQFSGG